MLFQRINRKNPERVFGIFQNVDAAAMADGEVVALNITATPTIPGSEIKKTTALSQTNVVGVVSGAIAIGDFGTVQVYGIHPNVKMTTAALAAGSVVYSNAAAAAEVNAGAIARADMGTLLGVSVVVGAANRAQVFLKCMG
jgi:predicted RecA/RadA family phage recombinase